MADDDADKRATDFVVYGSSSPTPAASSAGASSPAIPANMTSVDWCGLGKGFKGCSRTGHQPPWSSGTSGSTGAGSTQGLTQSACRPWDRGDLLKRLSTFKSDVWQATPKICGPLACARRGWVNAEDDMIACETCDAHIKCPFFSSRPENQAGAYDEQLDAGHKASCPWKGNPCAESLAQFLPSPISALVGGFNDRCDALLQFSSLPIISSSAIDEMKITRGPEIDRLLAKPVRETVRRLEDGYNLRQESIDAANNPYFQAQRLISLCGWEPRFLPNVVDCEEHSAYSSRKGKSVPPGEGSSHRLREASSFLQSRTGRLGSVPSDLKFNAASAVLDCGLCGASVSLKPYALASRPIALISSGLINIPELPQKSLMRNVSAASGIDGFHAAEPSLKDKGDEVAMNLNLTMGGGPTTAELPHAERATSSYQFIAQPEGSEMGGRAASYESFGPGFAGRRMDEGGSTVDRPQSRMQRADSVEGTVLDFENDEVDDGEVRRRSYIGESSKRKLGESSGASQGLPLLDPSSSNVFPADNDNEVDDSERLKKRRREAILQELNIPRPVVSVPPGSSVYASSVIAVDTCHSKQENSTESVENFPQDDDTQGVAFSWEKSERVGNYDLNYLEQAQQSTCHQGNSGDGLGEPSNPGVSTSDEGDVDTAVENDAACYGNAAQGLSVGMSGGSVQMAASHEAEIHGADLSVHKMESLGNDAELITEVNDNGRQTSESMPRQTLTGQSLPDDKKLLNAADSVEAVPSLSVAKVCSDAKHEDSGQEESWEGKQKGSQGSLCNKVTEVNHVIGNLKGHSGANSTSTKPMLGEADTTVEHAGKRRNHRRTRDHIQEFDPIHEHQFYCPWINGYVAAAAGNGDSDFMAALCGWQLSADALDAVRMQNSTFIPPMASESAASMHKGNGFSVNDVTGRQSSSKKPVG